jgi:hypothetical protein
MTECGAGMGLMCIIPESGDGLECRCGDMECEIWGFNTGPMAGPAAPPRITGRVPLEEGDRTDDLT